MSDKKCIDLPFYSFSSAEYKEAINAILKNFNTVLNVWDLEKGQYELIVKFDTEVFSYPIFQIQLYEDIVNKKNT